MWFRFYYHQYLWARDNLSVHWHSIYAWMRNLRWLYTIMYLYSRRDTIFLQNSMNNILDFRQKLIKSSLLTVSLQSTYFRTVVSIEIRKKSGIFQRYDSCILCTGWKNIWKYNVFTEIRQIYLQLNSDS